MRHGCASGDRLDGAETEEKQHHPEAQRREVERAVPPVRPLPDDDAKPGRRMDRSRDDEQGVGGRPQHRRAGAPQDLGRREPAGDRVKDHAQVQQHQRQMRVKKIRQNGRGCKKK